MRGADDRQVALCLSGAEYAALEKLRVIVGASSVPNLVRIIAGQAVEETGLGAPDLFRERAVARARGALSTPAVRRLRGELSLESPHSPAAGCRRTLTDRFVRAVRSTGGQRDHWDTVVAGLGLRVGGRRGKPTKTWCFRYRIGRAQRRWTIGRYPDISLADAREKARIARAQLIDGVDPAREKRERRQADSIAELVAEYLKRYAEPRKKSWKDDQRMFDVEVLPAWRTRLARDVERRDVRALLEEITQRGHPVLANRVRSALHKLFAWGVEAEIVDRNPVAGLQRNRERPRDRVLSADELRKLWTALEGQALVVRAMWQLRLLTAQRGGEVIGMRWADVDLVEGWWVIPASASKNGLVHRVPLAPMVVAILAELLQKAEATEQYVLAGVRGKHQRAAAGAALEIENFRGHDLRRTAATMMTSAGAARLVVSKILNHAERGVTAVYDRASYDGEKRAALERWARQVAAVVQPSAMSSSSVLPFSR